MSRLLCYIILNRCLSSIIVIKSIPTFHLKKSEIFYFSFNIFWIKVVEVPSYLRFYLFGKIVVFENLQFLYVPNGNNLERFTTADKSFSKTNLINLQARCFISLIHTFWNIFRKLTLRHNKQDIGKNRIYGNLTKEATNLQIF